MFERMPSPYTRPSRSKPSGRKPGDPGPATARGRSRTSRCPLNISVGSPPAPGHVPSTFARPRPRPAATALAGRASQALGYTLAHALRARERRGRDESGAGSTKVGACRSRRSCASPVRQLDRDRQRRAPRRCDMRRPGSNASRMRARSSAAGRGRARVRTVPPSSPSHSASRARDNVREPSVRTTTGSMLAPRSSAPNSSSSENRKKLGPTGTSSGGVAPTAATASDEHAQDPRMSGGSHAVNATWPPCPRTRTASAATCSGRPTWRIAKLPTTASNDASANTAPRCPRAQRAEDMRRRAIWSIASDTSTPTTSAPRATARPAT